MSIWFTLVLTLPMAATCLFLLNNFSPKLNGEGGGTANSFGSDLFGVISALALQGMFNFLDQFNFKFSSVTSVIKIKNIIFRMV
jgi:hypothetical protein